MCGTAMRGADALPGSKATSRAKGSHRKLGDLVSGRRCCVGAAYDGPHREGEEPKPMMHGHEKSDPVIVAVKPANKVAPRCGAIRGEPAAAELVERRAGTKGNADRQSTHWTQSQARVSQALERIRQAFAVMTRGGSRMRESRTYGSVRGARDETASLPLPRCGANWRDWHEADIGRRSKPTVQYLSWTKRLPFNNDEGRQDGLRQEVQKRREHQHCGGCGCALSQACRSRRYLRGLNVLLQFRVQS